MGRAGRCVRANLVREADPRPISEHGGLVQHITRNLEDPRAGWRGFVLSANGALFGFAAMRRADDLGAFELDYLVVATDHRRCGAGRRLLQAIDVAVAEAGGRALLAAVTSSPGFSAARQFLTRTGFQSAGERCSSSLTRWLRV